ncbi:MAG: D-aminoacyl-tRNA deacylase [Bryobacteraceae bacterium]|jgi:D-tyrosyl-tRNA(Tyr) deacylase
MRVVLQRVREARVEVAGQVVGSICKGLLVFIGIAKNDGRDDACYLAEKIAGLRVFPDEDGKMNRNVIEAGGKLLVISQFTLYGDCRRGRRPSFDAAAPPGEAQELYEYFVAECRSKSVTVETGVFQAEMAVHLINDGPVTIICDSGQRRID